MVLNSTSPDRKLAHLVHMTVRESNDFDLISIDDWSVVALVVRSPDTRHFMRRMEHLHESFPYEPHEVDLTDELNKILVEVKECGSLLVFKRGERLHLAISDEQDRFDEIEKELRKMSEAAQKIHQLFTDIQNGERTVNAA